MDPIEPTPETPDLPETSEDRPRRDPTRRALVIAAAIVLVVLLALALLRRPADDTAAPDVVETVEPVPDEPAEPVAVDLYFPGEGGRLQAETHDLEASDDLERRVTAIVEALLAGPSETGLMTGLVAPLPQGITLSRVYVLDGLVGGEGSGLTMLVDFAAPAGPPPSGSLGEMLTVYSIVNSILFNVEEVEQVVLTWNGVQPPTFAGHLDTGRPLRANTDLVAGKIRRPRGEKDGSSSG